MNNKIFKNSCIEAFTHTPSTPSKCDHIWRESLQGGSEVQMRLLGWALISSDQHSYKRSKFGHKIAVGKFPHIVKTLLGHQEKTAIESQKERPQGKLTLSRPGLGPLV
jgi:hypothetical protein